MPGASRGQAPGKAVMDDDWMDDKLISTELFWDESHQLSFQVRGLIFLLTIGPISVISLKPQQKPYSSRTPPTSTQCQTAAILCKA